MVPGGGAPRRRRWLGSDGREGGVEIEWKGQESGRDVSESGGEKWTVVSNREGKEEVQKERKEGEWEGRKRRVREGMGRKGRVRGKEREWEGIITVRHCTPPHFTALPQLHCSGGKYATKDKL